MIDSWFFFYFVLWFYHTACLLDGYRRFEGTYLLHLNMEFITFLARRGNPEGTPSQISGKIGSFPEDYGYIIPECSIDKNKRHVFTQSFFFFLAEFATKFILFILIPHPATSTNCVCSSY